MRIRHLAILAGRNLRRQTRRTLITAGAVAVGLALYVFVDSMLLGVERESDRNIIWYETGAAQVVGTGYLEERDTRPLSHAVADADAIAASLEAAGLSAVARTVFSGELIVFQDPYPEDGAVPVTAYGIDPDDDDSVYRLPETLSDGELLRAGSNEALMGAWLAEDIGAAVGYPITLVTRTRQGYYQTIDLEIAGIVNTPNPIINRTAIFMPRDVANDYLQMGERATEIAVAATADQSLEELTSLMSAQLAGFSDIRIVDWRQIAADAVALAETKEAGTGLILFLVFVIAAVGVSNTVLMSILERTSELGMMRAAGMRDREVMGTLLLEAAGIGIIGGILGVGLGAAGSWFLVEVGIDYGSLFRDMDVGYRLTGQMYGAWNPTAFVQAFVAGITITVLTAVVPVRRAVRMTITDAIHAT